jgi:hypothetical protein
VQESPRIAWDDDDDEGNELAKDDVVRDTKHEVSTPEDDVISELTAWLEKGIRLIERVNALLQKGTETEKV